MASSSGKRGRAFKSGFGVALFAGVVAAIVTGVVMRSQNEAETTSQESSANVSMTSGARLAPTTASSMPSMKGARTPASISPADAPGSITSTQVGSKPLSTLNDILAKHADNDPRLDTELLKLDESTKKLFRERYAVIPKEEQNDRGTIVFLLGRNIAHPTDVQFLSSVLRETPCLSLENCETPPARTNAHESPSDMALAYSQAVSIVSFEKFLETNPTSEMRTTVLEQLRIAARSPSPPIARLAGKTLAKYDK